MRLLYIDIDTLRADHLGCYGYPRRTSPHIDRVAAEGVLFERVYASDTPCLPSRTALLTGRLWRDVLQLFVQAVILVVLGLIMGMRGSFVGIVVGILITLIVGGACAAASNALALTTKSEDVMAPVINMVMMPVLLLSGILLPMTLGPTWLQRLSDFMPFRWIVDGVRDSFAGEILTSSVAWGLITASAAPIAQCASCRKAAQAWTPSAAERPKRHRSR